MQDRPERWLYDLPSRAYNRGQHGDPCATLMPDPAGDQEFLYENGRRGRMEEEKGESNMKRRWDETQDERAGKRERRSRWTRNWHGLGGRWAGWAKQKLLAASELRATNYQRPTNCPSWPAATRWLAHYIHTSPARRIQRIHAVRTLRGSASSDHVAAS